MKIVLYTVIFGVYDRFPEHRLLPEIEYSCIAANDTEYNRIDASRYYKMMPHLIPGFKDYDISIYADGNFSITDPEKLLNLCKSLHEGPKAAIFFLHPDRQTPRQELIEVVRRGIVPSVEGIIAEKKMSDHGFYGNEYSLTENGFMIRKHNDPGLIKCEEFWWNEFMSGPRRDQISLQYSMYRTNFTDYKLMTCQDKLSMVKIKRHGE